MLIFKILSLIFIFDRLKKKPYVLSSYIEKK